MVSCRNLLIYLRPEAQQRALSLFHFALHDHGILFLGSAKSLGEATNLFDPIDRTHRIFQVVRQLHHPRMGHPTLWRPGAPAGPLPAAGPLRRTLADLAQRALLENYAPASVIIDRNRHGLYFSGPIDRFLRLATGTPEQDVLSMAREGLQPRLRTAIERAFRTNKRVTVHGAQVRRGAKTLGVTIEVCPVAKADDELLLISFIDEPAAASAKAGSRTDAEQEAVALLQAELDTTRKELSRTIRDLERSNEEITGANEEVISMNEELQATNEELETSEEELQSRNKELATLNTQLRQSLDAQSVAADDLTNLLNSTGIATLFLDARLRIKFFNPPASTLFSVIGSDVGRPLNDLAQKFADPTLLADAGSVLATGTRVQREIQDERGIWYIQTILPYRTASGTTDGVVITFADITAVKTAELAADRARVYAETIVNTMHEPLVVLDRALRIVSANPAFVTTFGLQAGTVPGRALHELESPVLRDRRLGEVLEQLARQEDVIADREIAIEGPGGEQHVLRVNGRRLPDGPPDAGMIMLAMEDFTERNRSIGQQFRSFLNAMPEPMMIVWERGRIRWVNAAFENLFGYRADELVGQSIDILVPADRRERHTQLHRAYLRDPTPRSMGPWPGDPRCDQGWPHPAAGNRAQSDRGEYRPAGGCRGARHLRAQADRADPRRCQDAGAAGQPGEDPLSPGGQPRSAPAAAGDAAAARRARGKDRRRGREGHAAPAGRHGRCHERGARRLPRHEPDRGRDDHAACRGVFSSRAVRPPADRIRHPGRRQRTGTSGRAVSRDDP